MEDKIQEGDLVEVCWENLEGLVGRVLYCPQATGDSWHIRCEVRGAREDGRLFYVQTFAMMRRIEAKP
jgi:hypothetical protein